MPIRKNEEFLKCFLADTEVEAENILEKYDGVLKLLANKASIITGLDKEDIYQEGIIGLARAYRDFDEKRSGNFKIYAIYKIKDAMREFGTVQAMPLKSPQYTRDAIRLAKVLRECLVKAGEYRYNALADVWASSAKYNGDSVLDKSIQTCRRSLNNLAMRSHTPVVQLLERAEISFPSAIDMSEYNIRDTLYNEGENVEEDIIEKITTVEIIERIKKHISEEDYELLWNRYIKGMTVRELSSKMDISAAHVSDKTQVILKRLRKLEEVLKGKKVMRYESNTDTKEVEPKHTS
jgi:RNA polymerase sigma factor (sigma-70 family)